MSTYYDSLPSPLQYIQGNIDMRCSMGKRKYATTILQTLPRIKDFSNAKVYRVYRKFKKDVGPVYRISDKPVKGFTLLKYPHRNTTLYLKYGVVYRL